MNDDVKEHFQKFFFSIKLSKPVKKELHIQKRSKNDLLLQKSIVEAIRTIINSQKIDNSMPPVRFFDAKIRYVTFD